MSREILAPFQLNSSGSVAITTDPNVQASQHVQALVSTQPGERVMLPSYGVSLEALVFAPNDPAVIQVIQNDVAQAMSAWEPTLTVNSVSPVQGSDPTQGQAAVNVDYVVGARAGQPGAGIRTATVEVGGRIIQDS